MMRCSACKDAWYCCQFCQRDDFPKHKLRCTSFAKRQLLADALFVFTKNTVHGGERALYRAFAERKEIQALVTPDINNVVLLPLVKYFNDAYVGLIRQDEPYFVEQFGAMHDLMNHSYICLLNITFNLAMDLKKSIMRSELCLDSLEGYSNAVLFQLDAQKKQFIKKLVGSLSHRCSGMDIRLCDPLKPMFHVRAV